MPSPFPGMDPYLEREELFHDFHERFIPAAAALLTPQVRPRYIVKLNEHVYIHELPANERRLVGKSDDSIVRNQGQAGPLGPSTVAAAPVYATLPQMAVDEERLAFIQIRDRDSMEIVTVVELLSPSNKSSDRQSYLAKRRRYLENGISLVEIDMLRGWPRMPLDQMPKCDYYVAVALPEDVPRVGVWPSQLRDKLPTISVPLRAPDASVPLNLKQAFDRVYDEAGYIDYIYRNPPQPALPKKEAVWAKQLLVAVS